LGASAHTCLTVQIDFKVSEVRVKLGITSGYARPPKLVYV
jgi:hypothetical protein